MRAPRMNDSPAACSAIWLASRDHSGVGDHGDVASWWAALERVDDRQHGGGLGLVALERLHRQREPGGVGQQPDGDLRFEAAFLGEPGLTEPVAGVGLEVQGGHVVEHQAGRSQPGVRRACR